MFDLAAKLTWNAMEEDQYQVGKRDIATLYEYWKIDSIQFDGHLKSLDTIGCGVLEWYGRIMAGILNLYSKTGLRK